MKFLGGCEGGNFPHNNFVIPGKMLSDFMKFLGGWYNFPAIIL